MTTTTRNEAAERLRQDFGAYPRRSFEQLERSLDAALAAERRATVERIWQRVIPTAAINGEAATAIRSILDEEAAR